MEFLMSMVCIFAWGYLELTVYLKGLHHAMKHSYETPKVFVEIPESEPVVNASIFNIPEEVKKAPQQSEVQSQSTFEEDKNPFVYVESKLDATEEAFLAEMFAQTENIPLSKVNDDVEQMFDSASTKPLTLDDLDWIEEEVVKGEQGVSEQAKGEAVDNCDYFYPPEMNAIWEVEVIGKEAGYIHVLHEGTRKWLFIGEHNYSIYSILKLYLDFSQGVEDVYRIEVLYEGDGNNYNQYHDDKHSMIL